MEFLKKIEKAHDTIDGLIQKTDIESLLKGFLQEKTNIQDSYPIGKQGKGYIKNNLLDSIIQSQLKPQLNLEDLLNVSVGGKFGKQNGWGAELSGGKGRVGFNISKLF